MTAIWRHKSKTRHDKKNKTLSKCVSGHTKQLLPWSTLFENQVKVSKQEIKSKKSLKNGKMMTVWRHTSKSGHEMKKIFQNVFSGHTEELLPWSTLLKIQVKVTKQEIKSKNYWKTAKWRLYDVIRQNRNMR